MHNNQDEIAQLRADLTALQHEVLALRSKEVSPAAAEAAARADQAEPATATAPSEPPPKKSWDDSYAAFKAEASDKKWARMRQGGLLAAATEHIQGSGASLQSVSCKATACLMVVDVPAKTRRPYEPMANPWAEVEMLAHTKKIYNGKTRWSYLLFRHAQDTEEAGDARVDPLALAATRKEPVPATPVESSPPVVAEAPDAEKEPKAPAPEVEAAPPAKAEAGAAAATPAAAAAAPPAAAAAKPPAAKPPAAKPPAASAQAAGATTVPKATPPAKTAP